MDGLQPQFHRNRFFQVEPGEQGNCFRGQAVRTGADGKACNVRVADGFRKQSLQPFQRGVGIGISLKISDKTSGRKLGCHQSLLLLNLGGNGDAGISSKISRSPCTAENTAPAAKGAVPVGTGHAAV